MDFPPSVSNKRMGRPPLRVEKTTVRLPEGAGARIDALVGKQRRATFVRQAVVEKLERDECDDKAKIKDD